MPTTEIATKWVIRNSKTVGDDGPLYWNNETGWGGHGSAETYSDSEKASPDIRLPVDGVWQLVYDGMDMLKGRDDWFSWLQERGFTQDTTFHHDNLDPRLDELKNKLIGHSGCAVILPAIEPDMDQLLSERGVFINGGPHRFEEGAACKCHTNASLIWESDPERYRICTGYAMSDDGLWRQHSWAYDTLDNALIETTEPRIVYYGFMLNGEEAEEFFGLNDY